MASFNRVILAGNLTRDPEVKYLQSGTAVCEVGLAINEKVKQNDQWVEQALFVDVTFWGKTAEVAGEYLRKGAGVLIEGRLKLDQWEKDGEKRSKLKVVCERMQMLGGKRREEHDQTDERESHSQSPQPSAPPPPGPEDTPW